MLSNERKRMSQGYHGVNILPRSDLDEDGVLYSIGIKYMPIPVYPVNVDLNLVRGSGSKS